MKNDNRVIICKNAISESVLKTNKELRSTKKNHDDHGLGHQIVETILKKYDGWVDYFETEDMFGVQIMLSMPRQNMISKNRHGFGGSLF
jgi:regulator of RNase E activity RraB